MDEPQVLISGSDEISLSRTDQATIGAMEELRALTNVMEALRGVANDDARCRILRAAATFFRVPLGAVPDQPERPAVRVSSPEPTPFSITHVISPKEFLLEKQPKTDVERVACLAYFLTHHRETPHFKTIDISKLNTEAAQPKLSNAAMAVDNATKSHYLVPAAKGNKQISASGELFVQALPERELARQEMLRFRPRKKAKRVGGNLRKLEVIEGE